MEAAQALADELGPRAVAARSDVLDEPGLRTVGESLMQHLPHINGVVNCAGIAQVPAAIEEFTTEQWSRILDSLLTGTYISCRVFGAAMAARGAGAVVNIASVLAFRPRSAEASATLRPSYVLHLLAG
jgi:NAD(P)-dependent dehydrogenase (short-subunit alcohol dehydrogenase family)